VLELADQLGLSDEQARRTRELLERMRAEAVPLGEQLLAQETALERVFEDGKADEATLARLTAAAAELQGRLRFTHLKYHLATRDLLQPEQVAAYDGLRGYGDGGGQGHRHHQRRSP
jgi:hypothetical protein